MSHDNIGIGRGKKRDIVAQIKASNKDRVETLMPIRHGRMLQSGVCVLSRQRGSPSRPYRPIAGRCESMRAAASSRPGTQGSHWTTRAPSLATGKTSRVEVEQWCPQLHGLRRGRHSRRRLQSESAGQYRHRSRCDRFRRRLHLLEPRVRHGILRRRRLHLQFHEPRYSIPKRHDPLRLGRISQFLSKQVFVGFVGYAYQQLTDDFGQPAVLGGFRSRVLGIGPQIGYIFPIGANQGFLGLKGYGELDAANRPSGWNTWLTFAIPEAAPTSTVTPTNYMVRK